MKTLIINSYAGSLTIGASNLRQEIIGSYEDANFGLDIQKANFPWLNFRSYHKDWPKQDLSEVMVLAHPPCSAFSTLNTSREARGINSEAFACTRKVLDYSMKNRAVAIAIESVTGALGGAWHIHQKYAEDYGYHVYRVLQTGSMFSCQWRERFWVIFIRKGAASPDFNISLTPRFRTVKQVVGDAEEGPTFPSLDRQLTKLKTKFIEEAGCTPEEMDHIFGVQDPHHETQGVNDILWRLKFPNEDPWEICRKYVGTFSAGQMIVVDPNGLSPTLLGGSWWYMNGRNMSMQAYKLIGGFPANYIFPRTPRNFESNMRMYISKGVIPAVAEWVARNILRHLGEKTPSLRVFKCGCAVRRPIDMPAHEGAAVCPTHGADRMLAYNVTVPPDDIADFRIRRRHWMRSEMPPLRQEDDFTTLTRLQKKPGVIMDMTQVPSVREEEPAQEMNV